MPRCISERPRWPVPSPRSVNREMARLPGKNRPSLLRHLRLAILFLCIGGGLGHG